MIKTTISQTGVGVSLPIVFSLYNARFLVGIGCAVTGTVTYTIEHTFDDVFKIGYNPASGTWFAHDDPVFVNATTNQNSNFVAPCRAARINVTAGSGTVSGTFLQSGKA